MTLSYLGNETAVNIFVSEAKQSQARAFSYNTLLHPDPVRTAVPYNSLLALTLLCTSREAKFRPKVPLWKRQPWREHAAAMKGDTGRVGGWWRCIHTPYSKVQYSTYIHTDSIVDYR